MKNKFLAMAFTLLYCFGHHAVADDENPTADDFLAKIEASTVYKEILKSGFSGKNDRMDLAILEIMATKAVTAEFADKMSEEQMDLAGWILSYGKRAKKLPAPLVKAFRGSPNFQLMARKFSGYGPTAVGSNNYSPTGYCFPGSSEVIAYPVSFDKKLEMGTFAQVVGFQEIESGVASINYVPRKFVTKNDSKTTADFYKAQEKKFPTAVNVSENEMNPKVIESVMKEHKAKQVILDIPYSQITSATEDKNGVAIAAWNSKNPGHAYLVKIPMKKALSHSKNGGWREGDKPGCDEDEIHVVATFEGTENLPNKLGQLLVVPVFKAKMVYDEYDFYEE